MPPDLAFPSTWPGLMPEDRAPKYPAASQLQLWALIGAFERGEELTFLDSVERYGICALSQRCGELRNKYNWPIKSRWDTTVNGARIKVYSLPVRVAYG